MALPAGDSPVRPLERERSGHAVVEARDVAEAALVVAARTVGAKAAAMPVEVTTRAVVRHADEAPAVVAARARDLGVRPPERIIERGVLGHVDRRRQRRPIQGSQDLGPREEEDVVGISDGTAVRQRIADPENRAPHDRPGDGQLLGLLLPNGYEVLRIRQQAAEGPEPARRGGQSLEGGGLGRLPCLDHPAVSLDGCAGGRLEGHGSVPPIERHDALTLQTGRLFEPREERQVAAAERRDQVASIEPGEVHLELVRRTAQRCDRGEVLAGELGELVDQRRKVGDRQRLHSALGIGHRGPVARLEIVAPHALGDRNAVAHGWGNDPGDVPRVANEAHQHPRQAAQEGAARYEIDRIEVPAIDHDVVGPRCDLTDQLP